MCKRGIFISLEGIDGSGKTSLNKHIIEYIGTTYNKSVVTVREPGGTFISEKIRELLLDIRNEGIIPRTEALLYASARSQVVEEIIRPALACGQVIVADRYLDSTIAYQGYGRGLNLKFLTELNILCTGGIVPDLTLLLDIKPIEARQRRKKDIPDRLEKEGLEFQQRVRKGYLQLAKQEDRIKIIEASLDLSEVVVQAVKYIDSVLGEEAKR